METVAMANGSICIETSAWTDVTASTGGPLQPSRKWTQAPCATANQTHRIRPAMRAVGNGYTCICCKLLKHHWSQYSLHQASIGERVYQGFLLLCRWFVEQPIFSQHFFSWNVLKQQLPAAIMPVGVSFLNVHLGFLQLLLTQTWIKRTSLDSSRCAV